MDERPSKCIEERAAMLGQQGSGFNHPYGF